MEVMNIQAEIHDQQRKMMREKYEQEREKEKQRRNEDKRKVGHCFDSRIGNILVFHMTSEDQ